MSAGIPVRVWDSGLRAGSENLALDRQWLHEHALGNCSNLLRFHRYQPSASVGRHQALDRELRLDYCRRQGIEVLRRPSGGGALYQDAGQLALSLIIPRPPAWHGGDMGTMLQAFCRGLARGLRRLGLAAAFKAPNDLEVGGRKLASAFLTGEGESLLFQAFLLLEADVRCMLQALRVPTEKLSPSGLAGARERLITLGQCLGRSPAPAVLQESLLAGLGAELGLRFQPADAHLCAGLRPTPAQEAAEARRIDWSEPRGEALEALWRTAGGVLRARVTLDAEGKRIRWAEFAADLHLRPATLLETLQAAMADLPVPLAGACVAHVLQRQRADLLGCDAADLQRVLQLALDKFALRQRLGLSVAEANALMLHAGTADAVLERAQAMLVPYCAKPAWCKWRHLDGCTECGKCEVGEAYRLARERGMPVTSINNYEHLVATLARMRAQGVQAYVGMCCSNFFIKRHRAFREAGMPALLMDISGSNCYELQQEEQAYAGTFQAQARLEVALLRRVMQGVPGTDRTQSGGVKHEGNDTAGQPAHLAEGHD
ncbi:DUF116 domain-containing protein [Thermithiobacillus tepidarius DSM 3134]|uniref:lipoyl protein ligase domain-containing protein n=1 Tax=Thermithiobacillus tepidarius TaxID=929 RepID=UPI0004120D57|nr:DUF116 domain-containing protein [Thermithiobacillus tepidarius]